MDLRKITEEELSGKGVIGQPDVPGLSAQEMQEKVEEIPRYIIERYNELVEWLLENGATQEDLENIVVAAGAVTSVFGRMGTVVPQAGDYNAERVGAAEKNHAAQHRTGGADPIAPGDIGAAAAGHNHGNITGDGKIGEVNGKIVMTGVGGTLEAAEKENAGFVLQPRIVATSGTVSVTVEDNCEYEYTAVTSLNMVGANVECHGIITFGASAPSISVTGFSASGGDDVAQAAANETWEFDVFKNRIVWKNWSA